MTAMWREPSKPHSISRCHTLAALTGHGNMSASAVWRDASLSFAATSSSAHARRGVSKAVFVYDDLRGAIVSLALKPGARIDKNEICERLGVSRQPLAEAIARL